MCADSWVYCRGRAGLSSPGGATQHIATPLNHTHFFLFHCKIHHFFNKFTKWCVFIFFLAKQNKKGVYILSKYTLWYNTAIKRGKKIPWNWPACLFSVFVSLHKSSDVFLLVSATWSSEGPPRLSGGARCEAQENQGAPPVRRRRNCVFQAGPPLGLCGFMQHHQMVSPVTPPE